MMVELLHREHDELPWKSHHCRVASFREDLQGHMAMVQGILDRLHATSGV